MSGDRERENAVLRDIAYDLYCDEVMVTREKFDAWLHREIYSRLARRSDKAVGDDSGERDSG